jgi:Trk-type K+ transport systems, membrane components
MRRITAQSTFAALHRLQAGGNLKASPPKVLAGGFLILILLGTLLLALPFSSRAGGLGLFEAFFTATASVTVTGLSIVPFQSLSLFGQWVVIILVQIGGLGFVTFAVVSAITLGNRMSLRQQSLALEAFNQTSMARLRDTAVSVLRYAVVIVLSSTLLLSLWWWGTGRMDIGQSLLQAFFHSVAAFNNAGIAIFDDGLRSFTGDPVTIAVLSLGVIIGGIGFPILAEILRKRRWSTLSIYVRAMLWGTLILNLVGFGGIWALEYSNPLTLGQLGVGSQALAAWMQSVSLRTAGFVLFDMSVIDDSTALLSAILMFIGGGTMSTAGGIKLGTFIVILAAVYSYLVEHKEVVIMKRSVSPDVVQKALAVVVVTVLTIVLALLLLTIFEDMSFITLLFEVMGALSTTGLSEGITGELSTPSQCVLIALMFMGRVGPLTLVYSLATRARSRIRYPEMEFQVG